MGERIMRLCTICARGNSKGVKNKNIRPLQGRPLIAHTVEQALASRLFAAVAVSSDSDAILSAAQEAGASILIKRPENLATDTAAKVPAILHCLVEAERQLGKKANVLVDLDATSPLRLPEDIVNAVALLEQTGATSVITGTRARRSPYFNIVELDENGCARLSKTLPKAVSRRQDSPKCFDMNASIYVWRRDAFVAAPAVFYDDTRLYEMPEDRSIDIDSEFDFEIVQYLMEKRG